VVVERGVWQGSRLMEGGPWTLLGCTVSPGFESGDYELGCGSGCMRIGRSLRRRFEADARLMGFG
jgi:predicted cupin superfamily sugar epimerase